MAELDPKTRALLELMALAGSLGMSTGPLLGGLVYDRLNSYTLMYVASWGMGLAAMAVLMAFRPFPRKAAGLAQA